MMRICSGKCILLAVRLVLGGVFVYAGAIKFVNPEQFADSIASFRLLPDSLVNLVAMGLPPMEILAGLMMVAGWQRRVASLGIVLLTLVFALALAQALIRGLPIDCGCFGSGEPSVVKTWIAFARDILLFAAALCAYSAYLKEPKDTTNRANVSPR